MRRVRVTLVALAATFASLPPPANGSTDELRASVASRCGGLRSLPVEGIVTRNVRCRPARRVVRDWHRSRNGCTGTFGTYCHNYFCDFKYSRLRKGETYWRMSCRRGSQRIRWWYRQGGE